MASANSIIALLLTVCMLLSPVTYQDGTTGELAPLVVSLESVDGLSISGGLNKTADGQPVIFIDANGIGLTMSNKAGYVSDGTGIYTVPVEDLLTLFTYDSQSLPEPTEDDMMAFMLFAQGVMADVSPSALGMSVMGTGMSFSIDLDQLAHDLHTAVPSVLTTYAPYFDPTLEKYAPYLFGEVITSAQLAEAWPQLGLDQVETGLTASLTVLQNGNTITLIGSVAEANFIATITDDSFAFEATTADGTTYAFDSADIATIAQLLAEVPQHISSSAFSYEQVQNAGQSFYPIITTTIKLDTTALATDLNRGLVYTIATNYATVDELLNKYRSWIALLSSETLAANLTASTLVQELNNGILRISLPAATGELVVVVDEYNGTTTVDAFLNSITLNGIINSGFRGIADSKSASFTLMIPDRYEPFVINCDYAQDFYASTLSINSSHELFGLFRTLTLSTDEYGYDLEWHLSTDTNVISVDYSDKEQYASAKLGPVNAKLHVDENELIHIDFYSPEFFAELHSDGWNINFDSTIGGFDYAENYNGFVLNGYLADHYIYRTTFGVDFKDSYYNSALSAYLNTSDGESSTLLFHNSGIDFTVDGTMFTVRAVDVGSYDKVGLSIAADGAIFATLVLTEEDTRIVAEVYQGTDITVAPYYIIALDAAPEAYTAPADVTVVDATTFLQKVEALF